MDGQREYHQGKYQQHGHAMCLGILFLHDIFNLFDGRHSRLVGLVHVSCCITGGITLELTLVECLDECVHRLFVHMVLCEFIRDIVV